MTARIADIYEWQAHQDTYAKEDLSKTFDIDNELFPSGVNNLPTQMTANGIDVMPLVRYNGGDAASGGWDEWGYGDTLSLTGSGSDPTYNDGSPCMGTNDDSVKFNAAKYFRATDNTIGDIGTEDFAIELVFKTNTFGSSAIELVFKTNTFGSSEALINKRILDAGYLNSIGSTGALITVVEDSTTTNVSILSAILEEEKWYYSLVFGNRDENSTNGSQSYINGISSGSGKNISALGSLTNTEYLSLGARGNGTILYNSNIAYAAVYKQSNWFQAGAAGPAEWATIAAKRFQQLCGYQPNKAVGTDVPTVVTRSCPAWLEKFENSKYSLYPVGDEWIRQERVKDKNGVETTALFIESQYTNKLTYSEDFSNWTLIDSGDVVVDDIDVGPDKRTIGASIAADSTSGQHGVSNTALLTAEDHTFSAWTKPGTDDWCKLEISSLTNVYGYFNVSTGALGATPSNMTIGIKGPYLGNYYRVWGKFAATAATHTMRILPASADNNDTTSGDASTPNIYVWGAQVEAKGTPSSYIPTDASTNTRLKDQLRFKGDDGNITNNQEGSLRIKFLVPDEIDSRYSPRLLSVNDGGTSADRMEFTASGPNRDLRFFVQATGGNTGSGNSVEIVRDNEIHNAFWHWATNDFKQILDVTDIVTDTLVDIPNDLDHIEIGSLYNAAQQTNGHIAHIKIYDRILPS
jgi:hypothetical protein